MKSEVEQAMNISEVWAEEKSPNPKKKKLPGIAVLTVILALVAALSIGGSIWAYVSGLQQMQAASAQIKDKDSGSSARAISEISMRAQRWAFLTTVFGAGGGAVVLLTALFGVHALRRRWYRNYLEASTDSDARAQRLLAQFADAKVCEEDARKAEAEQRTLLANASQKLAALEKELEERKRLEKSLAQQASQLERSKDVLELHVQSRTQELQKLQSRNELILNSVADGICSFDTQGRATFANQATAKILGWRPEDIPNKPEEILFFPNKTGLGKNGSGLAKNEKGEPLPEQTFFRRDGSSFPAEYSRRTIKENGREVGVVVAFKDITERKQAEEKLEHKAAELARSNSELEQFAFVASHDLQEPLRKIQAFGDRLKAKCENVKLEEGKDYLDRMQGAAARMQTLINDLLTFSRVISSQQPFAIVDLNAVTQEVLGDLECRIERTGAQITVNKLPVLEADATQMRQLLQNLIGNALKFQAPNATPNIKIDAQLITRDQIDEGASLPKPPPTASPDDKFCVLTVQDNGIGFDEQYMDKVFAVFQRLHGRGEYEGTGVGLAVCRRIADRHGGLITAQSKPGEGSIFIVILPLKQPPREAQQAEETK